MTLDSHFVSFCFVEVYVYVCILNESSRRAADNSDISTLPWCVATHHGRSILMTDTTRPCTEPQQPH
jgi:hypothetical protein